MLIAGQWEVIGPLGEGGMGMVYKVRHFQMQEIVLAVKMLSPELMDNPSLLARFQREGSVMARFRHKHIVRVFSKGVEYDDSIKRYFILMEYIQGKTLRDHLRDIKLGKRQPFSLAEVVEIAAQVAEALAHAHNQTPPIVHRDIKPGNIMIEDPNKDFPLGRAVVMDWGIAKELKDADDTQLTGMWTMVGTPKYCSPEQMRPLETLTGSADIYSLGMVIYEMYTGRQFFADLDTEAVIRRVRDDPTEHEPRFDLPPPPEFAALVRRAIAKSRTRRYQRMEELLRDLELCRGASSEDRTATTIIRPVPGEAEGRKEPHPALGAAQDREELRRRLEEQQRALTLELQRDAQRVRERAVAEGAEEWAATVFQQAVEQQNEGERRLGERNYFLAQDAYNEAIRLFERAREEAVAGAMRQAEQARAAMSAAKQAAERYRARERARRFYTQGLACENEAGELWEQKRYRQAAERFAKAKSAFEDARELAAETLRNEIAAVQERVEAGQQGALAEDAAVLAAAVFAEAEQQARQAAVALEREDFTLAHQLYEAAAQQYAQAQQQARAERRRREILARQQRAADDARRRLQEPKAAGEPLRMAVEEQWTAAFRWEQQGHEAYQNERYEDARRLYEQAAQEYAQAQATAEQLRLMAEEGRARAEEARGAALQAQEYATEQFRSGEEARQEAERLLAAGRYGQAAEQYQEAIRRYRAAATEAEQARQLAARALEQQQRAAQTRQAAATVQAEVYAADLLAQARAVLARGEQELQEQHWVQAREAFEQAEEFFVRAQRLAQERKQQARAQAEAARETALGAQREARAGEQLFPDRWAQAVQSLERGIQALATEQYQDAKQEFAQAAELFQDIFAAVREIAEREALRAAAEAAREHAAKSRAAAETAGAATLAAELFRAAEDRLRAADAAYAQIDLTSARQLYEEAARQYASAQQQAHAEQQRLALLAAQRQAADEVYRQLGAAKAQAEAFQNAVEGRWEEAQRWEMRGRAAYEQAQYEEARQAYEQATREYTEVRGEGEQAKQRAHDARAETHTARRAALDGFAPEYAAGLWQRGEQAWQEAEEAEQEGRFGRALVGYKSALRAFTDARVEAAAAQRRRAQAQEARARTEEARRLAEAARATEYALAHFQEGVAACAQGDGLIAATQWEEAEQAFARAQSLFARARQEAVEAQARARRAAEQARAEALSTQQEAAGGQSLFPAQWAQACALLEQAAQAIESEEYIGAQTWFVQATAQFREILAATQEVARREALKAEVAVARDSAEARRKEAEAAEARDYAAEMWIAAQQGEADAASALAREDFVQARRLYDEAGRWYEQARARALAERQRRELLAVQRRATEELRQQLLVAKAAGEAVRRAVEELWAAAQQWEQRGDEAYRDEQYEAARACYERAVAEYRETLAEGERRRQAAAAARAQTEEARKAAEQASAVEYAADLFQQAEALERAAEHSAAQQRYGDAARQYLQAMQEYEQARAAATEGQQLRDKAVACREQVEKARQDAVDARAERYVPELWEQARSACARGEQLLAAKQWREAGELFEQARERFARARTEAERERERARWEAEGAQRDALVAREAAAIGEQLFVERWREGHKLLDQAALALAEADYTAALAGFVQVRSLFEHIRRDALLQRQKEEAERARQRAHELQRQAPAVRGKHKRRVEKALASGEVLLQQGRYTEAQARYEEAASLLSAVPGGQASRVAGMPGSTMLVSGGALAFGVAIALYWAVVARSPAPVFPPDEPTVARQPVAPREKPITPTAQVAQSPVVPPQASPELSEPAPLPEGTPPAATVAPTSGAGEEVTPTQPVETVVAKAAPTPEPAPPVSPLPRITEVTPDPQQVVTVKEGERLVFALAAEGAASLRYTWFLDGKKQAEGKTWTYQPGFNDARERAREVRAVISDGKSTLAEQSWQVQVQNVNRPPVITKVSPKTERIDVTRGEKASLTVQAADPDTDDRLTYVWSMNGQEVNRGPDTSWRIPESVAEGQHRVTLEVVDTGGLKSQVAWNVTVKALAQPPRITDVQPRDDTVVIEAGTPVDFVVAAEVAGAPAEAKQLTYQWSVNNAAPQKTDTGRFRFTETRPGTYRLTAVAIGAGGVRSAPRAWTVEVRARQLAPPSPPAVGTELTEAEVREWLEKNYRQAWEGKDVDALVRLGVVPPQEAPRLKAILDGYKSFRVTLRDVDIQKNGKDKATVKFTRVDTVDGRSLAHPPMQFVIEKSADGRITRR